MEKSVTFEDEPEKTRRAKTPPLIPLGSGDSDSDDGYERNSVEVDVENTEDAYKVKKVRLGRRNSFDDQSSKQEDTTSVHTYASVEHTIGK